MIAAAFPLAETAQRWQGLMARCQLRAHGALVELWADPDPSRDHWRLVAEQLDAIRQCRDYNQQQVVAAALRPLGLALRRMGRALASDDAVERIRERMRREP